VHPPPRTTLAVLNGTTVAGAASLVAEELTQLGYHEPEVVSNDTTNPSRQHTEIYYEDGHRTDARGVANCLHISLGRVYPATRETRALANDADVAVFVGIDQSR
jgi:hypothetical protein